MKKEDVIRKFCELATKVGNSFDGKYAHDCFCGHINRNFQFDSAIIEFIEQAVNKALDESLETK